MNAHPEFGDEPIGRLVQAYATAIFRRCEDDSEELTRLLDKGYAKETFGLTFPFGKEVDAITEAEQVRYWQLSHVVAGREVRITSQWTARHRARFLNYLIRIGVRPSEATELPKPRDARHRQYAIGTAQNAVIRYILSNLGHAPFTEADWHATIAKFNHRCAYCEDADKPLAMEHVVPINKDWLGEHHLGNLVPSCSACNARKSDRDFREFLRDTGDDNIVRARISRVEEHMASHGYVPIQPGSDMFGLIEEARMAVATIANECIQNLTELASDIRSRT